jgi:tetratricopeptide (TPR) repeat protein
MLQKKFAMYDDAAELYDRALSICTATFGSKPHYKTGIYLNNRADIERKRGNYEAALKMYDESLTMLRATVGPMHSEW